MGNSSSCEATENAFEYTRRIDDDPGEPQMRFTEITIWSPIDQRSGDGTYRDFCRETIERINKLGREAILEVSNDLKSCRVIEIIKDK